MSKKIISSLMTAMLLFQLIAGAISVGAQGLSVGAGVLEVTIESADKAVLGKDTEVKVVIKNKDAAQWAYNVGFQLVLDDGLQVSPSQNPEPTEKTTNGATGQQTSYWKDVKNLAPGESYTFPVTVNSLAKYRLPNGQTNVPFSAAGSSGIAMKFNVYGATVARQLYEPPGAPTQTASKNLKIVPFTIIPAPVVKQVKGAGPNSAVSGSEYGEFEFTLDIVNNTVYPTAFSNLVNSYSGGLELYGFSPTAVVNTLTLADINSNERSFKWNDFTMNAAEGTKKLTFKGAFLDKGLLSGAANEAEADNLGVSVKHGDQAKNTLSYTAVVNGQTITDTLPYAYADAKDIIITKSVTPTASIGYNTELTYTLTVKTNEYYEVKDVVVTDTIGDGQTYVPSSGTSGLSNTSPVKAAGVTTLEWNIGDLAKEQTRTFTYKTKVDPTWSGGLYGTNPVYAGDNIDNEAVVTGTTLTSGPVTDSESTTVPINVPAISEKITAINGVATTTINERTATATVGDTLTFTVSYDASAVNAQQHNVGVMDYLPLGSTPDLNGDGLVDAADLTQMQLNGVTPTYDTASNMLYWALGDLPVAKSAQVQVKAVVQNNTDYVKATKGAENLVTLSYQNSPLRIESKRDTVKLNYAEPNIALTRKVNNSSTVVNVNGGQTVTVSVYLKNDSSVPVYNVNFTEHLPAELTNPQMIAGEKTFVRNATILTDLEFFGQITVIQPGATVEVVYKADVIDPIGAEKEISQSSKATYNSQNAGATTVNRSYPYNETLNVRMKVNSPTITKTLVEVGSTTGSTNTIGDKNNVRAGDWAVYKIEVKLPTKDIAYLPQIIDRLPDHQSLLSVFTGYVSASNPGVLVDTSKYTDGSGSTPKLVTLPAALLVETAGTTYTYFIKTKIEQAGSAFLETQKSTADFKWAVTSGGTVDKSITSGDDPIIVKTPNLTSSMNPVSVTLSKDEAPKSLTYSITNTGKGTAFDFIPVITVPAGYEIVTAVGGTIAGDNLSVTYPRQDLAGSAKTDYAFTVQLKQYQGSGSSFQALGKSGRYYPSHEAYTNDSGGSNPIGIEKFEQVTAQGALLVPGVILDNIIQSTTNTEDTSTAFPRSNAKIRPGDVVDYKLTATIPAGTQTFDLLIEDTIDSLRTKFEVVSVTLDPQAPTGSTSSYSNGKLTIDLKNSPAPSNAANVYTNTVRLRAIETGNTPSTGAFTLNSESFGTSAIVKWKPTSAGTVQQSAAVATTVNVIQPNVTIAPHAITNSQFSDSNPTIAVGYTLTNAGTGTAYVPSVEVTLPTGITAADISDGGTFSGGKVTWTGLIVAGSNGTKSITFKAGVSPSVGAGRIGLNLVTATGEYESTPTPKVTNQKAKVYNLNAVANQSLSVAPAILTSTVTGNTYGSGVTTTTRPGDDVTYSLIVNPPGTSSAYHVVLRKTGLIEQEITGVWLGSTPVLFSTIDNGYLIGDISGDTTVTVVTKVITVGDHSQNPYKTSFEPTITYLSAPTDSIPKTASATDLMQDVIEPNQGVDIRVDNEKLTSTGDNSTFVLRVNNTQGKSTAYSSMLSLAVTSGLFLTSVGPAANNESLTKDDTQFKWNIGAIPAGAQRELTFRVGSRETTSVTTLVYFQSKLDQYFSLPNEGGKKYVPLLGNGVNVAVYGQHVLNLSSNLSVTAGKDATFNHTLVNIGAGSDVFMMSLIGPYPTDLYVDNQKIASGKRVNGVWVWDHIDAAYVTAGVPGIPVNAGASKSIKLIVHVPEQAAYDNVAGHIYALTATGTKSTNISSVQDTITVTGVVLDGWSGNQERADWKLPVYGHGDPLLLRAVSAVNVSAVTAFYTNGTPSQEISMKLVNDKTYVQDGFKEWYGYSQLPDSIASGLYDITFIAKDAELAQLEIDTTSGLVGANNPMMVKYKINVQGQITDAWTTLPIANAKVQLIDASTGKLIAEQTTDAGGQYNFADVTVNRYHLVVTREGYAGSEIDFYAIPKDGTTNNVVVDAALSPFQITLSANPSTLLGDGKSQTELTAIIKDTAGQPVIGVTVNFSSPSGKGSFPSGTTAVTDTKGEAKVPFLSEVVTGSISVRVPVNVDVHDQVRHLSATAQIILTFDPGAIAGIVTEMDGDTPKPVAGAIVIVSKDFNNDGVTDFTARAVTKADGTYLIAIPRANTLYDMTITKPITVGSETKQITFPLTASVGTITDNGREIFPANKAAGGVLLGQTPSKQVSLMSKEVYSKMKGYLIDSQGNVVKNPDGSRKEFSIGESGEFNVQNMSAGTYQLAIAIEIEPGQEIIVNRSADGKLSKLEIQQNGEMNITTELIDPFGTVTDARTGLVIEGAHVELYYADTERNRTNGRTPGTLVALPELVGFDPNNNRNPQDTNAEGFYAYMVYGFTDYIVVVNKPRYFTYRSPIISVEEAIVRHDLQMTPIPLPGNDSVSVGTGTGVSGSTGAGAPNAGSQIPSGDQVDLAVEIFTDRATYVEGSLITYTIEFMNKTAVSASGVVIEAKIPDYTSVVDAAGGIVDKSTIRWNVGDLAGKASGKIVYKVQVSDSLAAAETTMYNEAKILAAGTLVNLQDDLSTIQGLLFSTKFGEQLHKRYIAGYPDGLFKADRSITRAEIAAIFARILDLQKTVKGEKLYSDVETSFWAAEYIEAATRAGLFGGYEDKTFLPDQPISRAELSTVISRFLKLADRPHMNEHFTDTASHWGSNAIAEIYRHHIIDGYPDGTFKPSAPMIRSEAVTMINRLLYRGPLHASKVSFPDMTSVHWAFEQVEESAVTHKYTRDPDGTESLKELIPEPLW
ncbi:S-layer homology domain-containing protein [Paenibacillus sp. 1_12]|uniref:S-layer homology domain-containing protein n=1 Tax=Paenibacillus sp. 1_12 TaxID=1566278 RepID=UPI0008E59DA1|nr:S-layer homology domain-containing protein [Paenibacillus sp. 1_12]SFL76019.1 S-layer homology domain-containing protein [Paenibacillus sp. 1_12]